MTVDAGHGPTRLSAGVSLIAGGIAGTLALGATGWWILLSPLGVLAVASGLSRSDRRLLAGGCGLLVAATLLSGAGGEPPAQLVAAVALAAVTWDAGERAIDLGESLGRRADTRRLELVGLGISVAVVAVAGLVTYALFVVGASRPSSAALLFLLVGVVTLLVAIRRA